MRKGTHPIILSSLILVPALTTLSYAGARNGGFIDIQNSTTGPSILSGTMSVVFNPGRPSSYLHVYSQHKEFSDLRVYFTGRDEDGDEFSCSIPPTSNLYAAALEIKNSVTNGSRLYVTKPAGSTQCDYVSFGNYSYYLD